MCPSYTYQAQLVFLLGNDTEEIWDGGVIYKSVNIAVAFLFRFTSACLSPASQHSRISTPSWSIPRPMRARCRIAAISAVNTSLPSTSWESISTRTACTQIRAQELTRSKHSSLFKIIWQINPPMDFIFHSVLEEGH